MSGHPLGAVWWCEAYGPPQDGVEVAAWPRCFLSADPARRRCELPEVCAEVMADERRRVFEVIQRGAAEGDEVALLLAEGVHSPDDLLGGPGSSSP